MLYLIEFLKCRAAHALRGGIEEDILVRCFEILQSAEEPVILRIGDDRGVEDVIAIAVIVQLLDELFYLFLDRS